MTEIETYVKHWFEETGDEVHCVCYGTRYKDWKPNHNEWGIVFNVLKKKTKKELASGELLPDKINIKGEVFKTDVIESSHLSHSYCKYSEDDPNLLRLQGTPNYLMPMKGGQEIVQFPTRWSRKDDGKFSCGRGTLGFFAIDNYDNRLIGVTNAHCVSAYYSIPSDRSYEDQILGPYNCRNPMPWYGINPKACFVPNCIGTQDNIKGLDLGADVVLWYPFSSVKRFMPQYNSNYNYIDCGILVPNPSDSIKYFDDNSYQQWQPIGSQQYTEFMPFATTAEINALPGQNIRVYATGRTTGPKGYGNNPQCWMTVTGVHAYVNIRTIDGTYVPFADNLIYNWIYPAWPYADVRVSAPGDSGSCILGDVNGVRKIIALNFAGNQIQGIGSRIDMVSSMMNIRAWESGGLPNKTDSQSYAEVKSSLDGYAAINKYESEGKTYWNMGILGQKCLAPAKPTPTPAQVNTKPVATFRPPATPPPQPPPTPAPPVPTLSLCGQCVYQYVIQPCGFGFCTYVYDAFFKIWEPAGENCGAEIPNCGCLTNLAALEAGLLPSTGFQGQTINLDCYVLDPLGPARGTWEYLGDDCENGLCICPEDPSPFYEGVLTANTVGYANCVFIPTPSATPDSCGTCEWLWVVGLDPSQGQWVQIGFCNNAESCFCDPPNFAGTETGQEVFTGCFANSTPTATPTASLEPTQTPLPTPSGTEPTPTPSGTEPTATPNPTASETPSPTGTDPTATPAPSNTDPTSTPSPTPSGTGPTPTPSGTEPTPTPSGTEPTPTPSGTEPTPTPSGTEPTPTPSATSSCTGKCLYIAQFIPTVGLFWLYAGDNCTDCGTPVCNAPAYPPTAIDEQAYVNCSGSI